MKRSVCMEGSREALRSAAFEERVNKDREAADWWRERASLWLRRAAEIDRIFYGEINYGSTRSGKW